MIENETVVLDCPALGIPPPTVVWYQNDQPLNLEVNSHISIQEAGRRLVIDEAQVPDAGKYTCRASNEAGEAENNYELEVWGEEFCIYIYIYYVIFSSFFDVQYFVQEDTILTILILL